MSKQSNKIGVNQGKKVVIDGHKFDSQQEADFYVQFVRDNKNSFRVHPTYPVVDAIPVGGVKLRGITYTPDFVLKDLHGRDHCIDVKNSYSNYGVKSEAIKNFKLFAKRYGKPVEVVIPRKGWFWLKVMSTTRKFEPIKMTSLDYDIHDYIGQ